MRDQEGPQLDAEALALFARKGHEGGPNVPQAGEANAVKVRRVMQLTRDLAPGPFHRLRILDLGCGEGVYAIEAALRGAEVLAIDARSERMDQGAAVAARHGLVNLRFLQADVRQVTRAEHGAFDVVYLLGLLYHLDAPDLFQVLARVAELCRRLLVVDTLIAKAAEDEVSWQGETFVGRRHREHGDDDAPEVRRGRLLSSIDNTFSFRLTRQSLVRTLGQAGFSSVLECHAPLEPGKHRARVTFAALSGEPVRIATYPWVNAASEAEIERRLGGAEDAVTP